MISLTKSRDYFTSDKLSLLHGFTTRKAGLNNTEEERLNFFKKSHPNLFERVQFVTPKQVHGRKIKTLPNKLCGQHLVYPGFDGLLYRYGQGSPRCLYIKTADCLSMIVHAPHAKVIGTIHMGWQGAYQGVISNLAVKLRQLNVDPRDVHVILGPSINNCCYNVPSMRVSMFKRRFKNSEQFLGEKGNSTLNLRAFAISQLKRFGIASKNLEWKIWCTNCQTDLFYSYRRDRQTLNRLLTFVYVDA